MKSDAYATGVALVALAESKIISVNDRCDRVGGAAIALSIEPSTPSRRAAEHQSKDAEEERCQGLW